MAGISPVRAARPKRSCRGGFTLIELLVVIAIIALLVTMLLPTLNRAKELARQAVCSMSLRNWSLASVQFASEHDGSMPSAYHDNRQGRGIRPEAIRLGLEDREDGILPGYPLVGNGQWKSWDGSGGADGKWDEFEVVPAYGLEAWHAFGTSWDTFREFGLTRDNWLCPSAQREPVQKNDKKDGSGGSHVQTDYMFVAGLGMEDPAGNGRVEPGGFWAANDGYAWHYDQDVPPPARFSGDFAADRVVAADLIRRDKHGTGNCTWNHYGSGDDEELPGWQGIAWGDGHVEPRSDGYYDMMPDPTFYSIYVSPRMYYWTE